MVGASLEEIEEEEEDAASVASGIVPAPKEGCYEIFGTQKDKSLPKPDFVKEIIQVNPYTCSFISPILLFVSMIYHPHDNTG